LQQRKVIRITKQGSAVVGEVTHDVRSQTQNFAALPLAGCYKSQITDASRRSLKLESSGSSVNSEVDSRKLAHEQVHVALPVGPHAPGCTCIGVVVIGAAAAPAHA